MAGTVLAALAAGAGSAEAGNACYRKVHTAPVYGTYTKHVLVRPAETRFRKIPAEYATVSEQIKVRPAQRIAHHVPAVTKTICETVMIKPARRVWQVSYDAAGNQVGCWVTKPAVYGNRYRTVVVRQASVRYSVIPAEYRTISKRVLVRPAKLVQHTIPAVYASRTYTKMISPGRAAWQPAAYICR